MVPSLLSVTATLAISQCIHLVFDSTNYSKNAAAADAPTLPPLELLISATFPLIKSLCSSSNGNYQNGSLVIFYTLLSNFMLVFRFVNTPHILPKAFFIVPVKVDNSIISDIL